MAAFIDALSSIMAFFRKLSANFNVLSLEKDSSICSKICRKNSKKCRHPSYFAIKIVYKTCAMFGAPPGLIPGILNWLALICFQISTFSLRSFTNFKFFNISGLSDVKFSNTHNQWLIMNDGEIRKSEVVAGWAQSSVQCVGFERQAPVWAQPGQQFWIFR